MQETEEATGSIPGSEGSLVGENDNPLQYSCLENLTDRGTWWTTVHRASKSQIRLKQLSTHTMRSKSLSMRHYRNRFSYDFGALIYGTFSCFLINWWKVVDKNTNVKVIINSKNLSLRIKIWSIFNTLI